MTDSPRRAIIQNKQLANFFIPFILVCVGLNQVSYWGMFKFSALPYLSFTALLAASVEIMVIPFLITVISIIIQSLAAHFLTSERFPFLTKKKFKLRLAIGITIGLFIYIRVAFNPSYVRYAYTYLAVLILLFPFFFNISEYFGMTQLKTRILCWVIPLLLLFAHLTGVAKAKRIIKGKSYQEFVYNGEKYRFVGMSDKYIICLGDDNQDISFVPISSDITFKFNHVEDNTVVVEEERYLFR